MLTNFNLSVAVTDDFMQRVEHRRHLSPDQPPDRAQEVRRLKAREVFDLICDAALTTGDPGLVFADAIERANPTPEIGPLEATNPCGEQPLLAYEACNLGSINLAALVNAGELDWDRAGPAGGPGGDLPGRRHRPEPLPPAPDHRHRPRQPQDRPGGHGAGGFVHQAGDRL